MVALIILGALSASCQELSVPYSNTKTNDEDRMFLVRPGENITFSVEPEGAEALEWAVNKRVQEGQTRPEFTWTVPDAKGIWEIHVTGKVNGKEWHREWVVSTLSENEAPAIFDSFSDGRYFGREQTDPWGRPLPEWRETNRNDWVQETPVGLYDASKGFLEKTPDANGSLFVPSEIAYGTWRIRYQDSLSFAFVSKPDAKGRIGIKPGTYMIDHAGSGTYVGHFWFRGWVGRELFGGRFQKNIEYLAYGYPSRYSLAWDRDINEYGSSLGHVPGWVELQIIRTPDGAFYVWVNGRQMPGTFNIDNTFRTCQVLWFSAPFVDSIEVYPDRYLFPNKSAQLGQYESYRLKYDNEGQQIAMKEGIVLNGRDIRLRDIATQVQDPAVFSYDQGNRTAICRTNLVLEGGAELILDGETLRMHGETDGEREIRVMEAATLRLRDATTTSDNEHYWLWRFTSPYEPQTMPHGTRYGYRDARCLIFARNSTIDRCGYMFLEAPRGLVLEKTRLSNLVEVPSVGAGIQAGSSYPGRDVAFWFKERMPTVPHRSLRGLTFTGDIAREPVRIVFEGGDVFGPLSIYDSVFEHATVEVRSHRKVFGGWKCDDWKDCWAIDETPRTLNLVNCRFERLNPANRFCWINPQYYLDVQVVDSEGNPVPGARVRVTNEADDERFAPVNLQQSWEWTCTYGEGYGYHLVPYQKWSKPKECRETVTRPDGHTPLPSDADNTMVLTDYTLCHEDNADEMRLVWYTSRDAVNIFLYVYDDMKGHLLKQAIKLPPESWRQGETHRAKLTYDRANQTLHLLVSRADQPIWDTGPLPIYTLDRSDVIQAEYDLDRVAVGILGPNLHFPREKGLAWNPDGYLSIFHGGVSSGGRLRSRLDNLRLAVDGGNIIEDDNFAQDPGLRFTMPDAMAWYPLKEPTNGRSFTWEFDLTAEEIIHKCCAASVVSLKGPPARRRNYTYSITAVAPDGKTKTVTGVDPGPSWYRPDPQRPTHTITIAIGRQSDARHAD